MDFSDEQVKMRSLGWDLMQHDWCPIKRENLDPETDALTESHVNMKAENRVVHLQAEGCQRWPANPRSQERGREELPLQPSEGTNPVDSLLHNF